MCAEYFSSLEHVERKTGVLWCAVRLFDMAVRLETLIYSRGSITLYRLGSKQLPRFWNIRAYSL